MVEKETTLPVTAYIALGANLGDANSTLRKALEQIAQIEGVQLQRTSSIYRSAPIDSSGDDYLNAVVELNTQLSPQKLWEQLQKIEQTNGRTRPYRNAPRSLDLDILLYGNLPIRTDELTIPHPRMNERAFVLQPLHEIAPHLVAAELLQIVSGQRIERLVC